MTRKEKDHIVVNGLVWECFACLDPFEVGDSCWIHPLYPGERVCEDCYDDISENYKYMLED